jgi:acyl-CoA synthetase (AMP-forming)/AMP-acid ligase II
VVFSVEGARARIIEQLGGSRPEFLATDRAADLSAAWHDPDVNRDTLALLQYTSGSTDDPRGVMVTHGNLLHNSWYSASIARHNENTPQVSWVPFFHDMGLVGGIVAPVVGGYHSYVMAPATFLQKPVRLLKAISRYRAYSAPGPNFAYDLCVDGTTPEECKGLDLSCWKAAWNGAEPIRADTLKRFAEAFAPYGFRPESLVPCYGMAETTLCVSASPVGERPITLTCRRDALERHSVEPGSHEDSNSTTLVSSGRVGGGMKVEIVNPQTYTRCRPNEVGEIWVSGPSVTRGYWNRTEATLASFGARIEDTQEGPYLRTGDLGFIHDGELFVSGRLKDLIIIRGRNLYPQDVERVAEQSHPALEPSGCAAFSLDVDGSEELAIVAELRRTERRNVDVQDVFEAVAK